MWPAPSGTGSGPRCPLSSMIFGRCGRRGKASGPGSWPTCRASGRSSSGRSARDLQSPRSGSGRAGSGGPSTSADVADRGGLGGYRTGPGSHLVQVDGHRCAGRLPSLTRDYTGGGLDGGDKARGLGLRNILLTARPMGHGRRMTIPGVLLEGCVFSRLGERLLAEFPAMRRSSGLLGQHHSSTCERGAANMALRIGNRGDLDTCNNLKFLHPRIESLKRSGLEIASGGPAPYQNNKIEGPRPEE